MASSSVLARVSRGIERVDGYGMFSTMLPTHMRCKERDRLLRALQASANEYSEAVDEFQKSRSIASVSPYSDMDGILEAAHNRCENDWLNLKMHIQDHQCQK